MSDGPLTSNNTDTWTLILLAANPGYYSECARRTLVDVELLRLIVELHRDRWDEFNVLLEKAKSNIRKRIPHMYDNLFR